MFWYSLLLVGLAACSENFTALPQLEDGGLITTNNSANDFDPRFHFTLRVNTKPLDQVAFGMATVLIGLTLARMAPDTVIESTGWQNPEDSRCIITAERNNTSPIPMTARLLLFSFVEGAALLAQQPSYTEAALEIRYDDDLVATIIWSKASADGKDGLVAESALGNLPRLADTTMIPSILPPGAENGPLGTRTAFSSGVFLNENRIFIVLISTLYHLVDAVISPNYLWYNRVDEWQVQLKINPPNGIPRRRPPYLARADAMEALGRTAVWYRDHPRWKETLTGVYWGNNNIHIADIKIQQWQPTSVEISK